MVTASILLGTGVYASGSHNGWKNTQNFEKSQFEKGNKMNKRIRNSFMAATVPMVMLGCGSTNGSSNGQNNNGGNNGNTTSLPSEVQTALNSQTSTLSEELSNTISYMGNEERLAYDVYNKLYAEWGTKQFTNIATKSEYKHITAVQQLVQKYKMNDDINFTNVDLPALGYMNTPIENMQAGTYDISKIQKLYDDLVSKGSTSEVEALEVGCIVEVVDVTDLNEYITLAEQSNATDVVTVFNFLRDGSYNHYWAFDKGLKNKGVSDGCCSLGSEYCHPEYPQKEKGQGQSQKNGQGKGRK